MNNEHAPIQLKETAEYYAEALYMGLVSVDEAVAWCDSVIATHPDPPLAIIQASMAHRQGGSEVSDALYGVEGEYEDATVYRRLFARLHEMLSRDAGELPKVLDALDVMSLDFPPVSKEVYGEMRHFTQKYFLLYDEPETKEMEAFRAEQTLAILDFLQQAARGEATSYALEEEALPAAPTSWVAYAGLIIGAFGTFYILVELAELPAGWKAVLYVFAIFAIFLSISKWRRER